jgi:hypothetical protein
MFDCIQKANPVEQNYRELYAVMHVSQMLFLFKDKEPVVSSTSSQATSS